MNHLSDLTATKLNVKLISFNIISIIRPASAAEDCSVWLREENIALEFMLRLHV